MPLTDILIGDNGLQAKTKLDTAFAQIDSNTTALGNKQPLDGDLTTIAALTPANDDTMQYSGGAWANRTPTQAKTALSLENVDNTSDATKNAAAVTLTNKAIDGGTYGAAVNTMKVRRGTNASIPAANSQVGELRFSTDTNELYIDNGGGTNVLLANQLNSVTKISTEVTNALALKQNINSVSTVIDNVRPEAADFTLANNNSLTFYHVTNAGASLGNIPADATIPQFQIGQVFKVLNNPTSANTVTLTPAGGVTLIFTGALNAILTPGTYALVEKIGANTWVRLI